MARFRDARAIDANVVASSLWPVSYAEANEFLVDLHCRHVLSLGEKRFAGIVTEQLALWSACAQVDHRASDSMKPLLRFNHPKPIPRTRGPKLTLPYPRQYLTSDSKKFSAPSSTLWNGRGQAAQIH